MAFYLAYAGSLGLSPLTATSSISLINFAAIFGNIATGALIDRLHVTTVIFISSIATTVIVFLGWGIAVSMHTLFLFSILYGLFAGGFTATWTGCVVEVRKARSGGEMGFLVGVFAAGRGLGAVISGPASEKFLEYETWGNSVGGAFGTEYGALIAFTGLTALLSGFPWLIRVSGLGVSSGE